MATRKLKPEDGTLWLYDPAGGTEVKAVMCLTQVAINKAIEAIESSTFCGDSAEPGKVTIEVPFEGEMIIGVAPEMVISAAELETIALATTSRKWKIAPASPQEGDRIIEFEGFLTQDNDTFQKGSVPTFSCSIRVDTSTYVVTKFETT